MISTNDCHLGRPFTSALSITLVERNSEGRQFVSSTIGGYSELDQPCPPNSVYSRSLEHTHSVRIPIGLDPVMTQRSDAVSSPSVFSQREEH